MRLLPLVLISLAACSPSYSTGLWISVEVAGNGVGFVTSTPGGLNCQVGTCDLAITPGAEVTLEASPAVGGTTFVGWSGACSGLEPCRLAPRTDVTVIAAFALRHSLVVTRVGKGHGNVRSEPAGIDCGGVCAELFPLGTEVTLTAEPEPGSTFEGWSGACAGTEPCVVTTSEAQLVTATFLPKEVVRPATDSGIVLPQPLALTPSALDVPVGSTLVLTATGGTPPYNIFVYSGGGSIDPAGLFTAPLEPGTTVVRVRDQVGDVTSATLNIVGTQFADVGLIPIAGPNKVISGDWNRDGVADLVVLDGDSVTMWLGGTNPRFSQRTISRGGGVTTVIAGDWNGDGRPDLAVAVSTGVAMLLGSGDGNFVPAAGVDGSAPLDLATGDFNRDGKADLVVVGLQASSVSVLLGRGDGDFLPPVQVLVSAGCRWVTTGDWNRDGKLDLAVTNSPNIINVLLGAGDGSFGVAVPNTVGSAPSGVTFGDLDGDGVLDLVVSNGGSTSVSALRGVGDGTFQSARNATVGAGPASPVLGDWDGDGTLDLAVALTGGSGGTMSIVLGVGDGTFGPAAPLPGRAGRSVVSGDWDRDGRPDLAATGDYSSAQASNPGIAILLNNTSAPVRFVSQNVDAGLNPVLVMAGDWNRDGKPDLATSSRIGTFFDGVNVSAGLGGGAFGPALRTVNAGGFFATCTDDWNRDGKPDLAVANAALVVFPGAGDGTFLPGLNSAAGDFPQRLATGDWNGDGKPDLAAVTAAGVILLLGTGTGSFLPPLSLSTGNANGLTGGDWNRDGKLDLAVVGQPASAGELRVLFGNGDGTFQAFVSWAVGLNPTSVATGDWNRDGALDLAVANENSNDVSVLLGRGDGTFQPQVRIPVGTQPMRVLAGDWSGDGWTDLAVANEGSNSLTLLFGSPSSLQSPLSIPLPGSPDSLATADWNGDGLADLAASQPGANVVTVLLSVR